MALLCDSYTYMYVADDDIFFPVTLADVKILGLF